MNHRQVMPARAWLLIRRYGFDAVIVLAAIAGAIEIAVGRNEPDAPGLPLGVST